MRPTLSAKLLLLVPVWGCGIGLDNLKNEADSAETTDGEDGGWADASDGGGMDGADGADGGGDADTDTDTDSDTDTDTDTDTDLDTLTISGVDPDYGTTLGGTRVTLTGGPFDATARVWFGALEGTVRSVDGSMMTVDSPSNSNDGAVDVRVETATHAGRAEGGFTYWQDAAGQTAAIGIVAFTTQVGTYWSGSATNQGSAAVYFTEPNSFEWWQLYAPSLDTCANEASYSPSISVTVLDPGSSTITLTPSSGSGISLAWDSALGGYANDYLTSSSFRASSAYRLQPVGGALMPDVGVDGFVRTSATPTIYSPSVTGSSVVNISRYQSFTWASATADWVLITMAVWDSAGTGYQELVNCVVRDDGSFAFDGSKFLSWPYGRQVDVYLGYAYEPTVTLPWNDGNIQVVGLNQIYGAGFSN